MREASSDTRSGLVYHKHNFIADHDKIHPRYMRECYIWNKREKGRQNPDDGAQSPRFGRTDQRSINDQTTSTKFAGNVPDLPLTFPVHLSDNPQS